MWFCPGDQSRAFTIRTRTEGAILGVGFPTNGPPAGDRLRLLAHLVPLTVVRAIYLLAFGIVTLFVEQDENTLVLG